MRLSVLALGVMTAGVCAANSPRESTQASVHPLIGKWAWTRETNGCTEVYEYRASGVNYVVSGKERTDNTYSVSPQPSLKGYYRLTAKIVKDYGGMDCFDSAKDDTGTVFTVYIMFDGKYEMHIVCRDESPDFCFGPLRRVAQ